MKSDLFGRRPAGGGKSPASNHHLRCALLTAVTCVCFAASANAQLIESTATGAHLAGGKVTVTFFGGPMATGTITGSGTTGTATFPGSFLFTVAGETSTADWTLTNLDSGPAARAIVGVDIDLTGSVSLFDDGTSPSTPVSLGGVAGATYVSGPTIATSGEVNPWTSASNLGDMYTAEEITWGSFTLPAILPGATAVWHDDTDRIVPEPATLLLLALTGLAVWGTRHRQAAPTLSI